MLPYFLRHYEPFVDRFFVFDDGSSDGSLRLLAAHPKVEVVHWERSDGESYALSQQQLSNECWKQSRGHADWVVVCDVDEHFYHPDLPSYLEQCQAQGVTMVPSCGYQMVGDGFPPSDERLWETVRNGTRYDFIDKMSFFDPGSVEEIGFQPGRHVARPEGRLKTPVESEMKLLHYKFIDLDHVLDRHTALLSRLGATDIERDFCHHWREEELREDYAAFVAGAELVI